MNRLKAFTNDDSNKVYIIWHDRIKAEEFISSELKRKVLIRKLL